MMLMRNLDNITFGEVTGWLTTHVDVLTGNIYCRLSERSISARYERLYRTISGLGKAGTFSKLSSPKIGDLAIAYYASDKKWHRVQIMYINESVSQVEAYFIDYGRSDNVAFCDLYHCPSQFAEVIPNAYECILDGAEPDLHSKKWNEQAALINELILNKECPGIPIRLSRNRLVLKLYVDQDATITVRQKLVAAGCSKYRKGSNIPIKHSAVNASSYIDLENVAVRQQVMPTGCDDRNGSCTPIKLSEINASSYLDQEDVTVKQQVMSASYDDKKGSCIPIKLSPVNAASSCLGQDVAVKQQVMPTGCGDRKGSCTPINFSASNLMASEKCSSSVDSSYNEILHSKKLDIFNKYLEISFTTGQEEACFITFTYGPHYFYINLLSRKKDLDKLMCDIASMHNSFTKLCTSDSIAIGQPCVVMYSQDGCYYRGEVVARSGNEVDVLFVDYGNKEFKAISDLKRVPEEFMKLERQAIECNLNGISPMENVYSGKVCSKFEKLTLDKNLSMTVADISNGILSVDLVEVNENNIIPRIEIAKVLIYGGLVLEGKKKTKKMDLGKMTMSYSARYDKLEINMNTYLDISPVHIHDPSQFCCHIVQNTIEFEKMTQDINDFYHEFEPDYRIHWNKMMPCIALYDEDNCWYRAVITSCSGTRSFEVTFVDYGNSAFVLLSNLRPICKDFMTLPAQVFTCCLGDVNPKGKRWSDEAIKGFTNFVRDKHLTAYIKGKENNLYSIVLYDTRTSPEVNVGQWLIQTHGAISLKANSTSKNCEFKVTPDMNETVYVSAVKNPGDFWVQLCRLWPELDEMSDMMDAYYDKLSSTDLCVVDPIIGQYCCAFSDNGWFRAVVENVNGKYTEVRYIDYGHSETVSRDAIKILVSEFESLPSHAIPCFLSGLQAYPSCDSSLNDLLLDRKFHASFLSISTYPMEVQLRTGGKSLTKELKKFLCQL